MTSLTRALGLLLRLFAYLFELVLSLFLLGVGIIAWVSEGTDLNLAMLPWEGATLRRMLPILGVVGIACVLLAQSRLRWIFPIWCLFVLIMMIRGFFLSSYSFAGANQFQFVVWLTAGGLIAFLGSLGVLRRRWVRR
jgi:hypothetical protein